MLHHNQKYCFKVLDAQILLGFNYFVVISFLYLDMARQIKALEVLLRHQI